MNDDSVNGEKRKHVFYSAIDLLSKPKSCRDTRLWSQGIPKNSIIEIWGDDDLIRTASLVLCKEAQKDALKEKKEPVRIYYFSPYYRKIVNIIKDFVDSEEKDILLYSMKIAKDGLQVCNKPLGDCMDLISWRDIVEQFKREEHKVDILVIDNLEFATTWHEGDIGDFHSYYKNIKRLHNSLSWGNEATVIVLNNEIIEPNKKIFDVCWTVKTMYWDRDIAPDISMHRKGTNQSAYFIYYEDEMTFTITE